MIFPHGEMVTRLRAGVTTDPYSGDSAADWTQPSEAAVGPVAIAPNVTDETHTVDGVRVDAGWTLYGPAGLDLVRGDRVRTASGVLWAVDGDPQDWRNPFTGWAAGCSVRIELIREA